MKSEEIVEEGIVVAVRDGFVHVELAGNENCCDCSARLFCRPKTEKSNILKLRDVLDVKPGDVVRISIQGSYLFKISLVLYGFPLMILLAGLIIGLSLFSQDTSSELFSFLLSVVMVAIYYVTLFFIPAFKNRLQGKPKITLVRRT